MRTVLNFSLGLLLLLAAGCGSIDTRWEGNHAAFAGTRFDADHVAHFRQESDFVAALDLPLSAVVDVLFLPYDLAVENSEPPQNAPGAAPASEDIRDPGLKQAPERSRTSK